MLIGWPSNLSAAAIIGQNGGPLTGKLLREFRLIEVARLRRPAHDTCQMLKA
jgi:hypothetical protein